MYDCIAFDVFMGLVGAIHERRSRQTPEDLKEDIDNEYENDDCFNIWIVMA